MSEEVTVGVGLDRDNAGGALISEDLRLDSMSIIHQLMVRVRHSPPTEHSREDSRLITEAGDVISRLSKATKIR